MMTLQPKLFPLLYTSPFHPYISSLNPSVSPFKLKFKLQASFNGEAQPQPRKSTGVVIVGAGLAGLAAATRLNSEKIPFILIEASDGVGGRVRTDLVDGFRLDRGFQVFITAYPEAQKLLDYQSLKLRKFYSGARVFFDGKFYNVSDPFRHFFDSLATLANPIGTFFDKLLIGVTRLRSVAMEDDAIIYADEVPISELLKSIGFSESIVQRFFKPFFGGIFFDPGLTTTSRLFFFIFKCLALGSNTLPEKGIGDIPEQLAANLPSGSILLNSRVASVEPKQSLSQPCTVKLEDGSTIVAEMGVIIAVEQPEVRKIISSVAEPAKIRPGRKTVTIYFTTDKSRVPVQEPVLFLNGSGEGIVNNMFFATNVVPAYGPAGKALVSATVIGLFDEMSDEELAGQVVKELTGWFGESVTEKWKYLRLYRIAFAQPDQCPPTDLRKDPKAGPGLYICGDHVTSATFDGALVSGRRAADCLLKEIENSSV